jgi:hypothetical protein
MRVKPEEKKPTQVASRNRTRTTSLRIRQQPIETLKFAIYVGHQAILNISLVCEIISKTTTNTPPDGVTDNKLYEVVLFHNRVTKLSHRPSSLN